MNGSIAQGHNLRGSPIRHMRAASCKWPVHERGVVRGTEVCRKCPGLLGHLSLQFDLLQIMPQPPKSLQILYVQARTHEGKKMLLGMWERIAQWIGHWMRLNAHSGVSFAFDWSELACVGFGKVTLAFFT